jgi:hypothetical protein
MAAVDKFIAKLVHGGHSGSFTSCNASPNYYRSPSCIAPACAYTRTSFALSGREPRSDLLLHVLVCAGIPYRFPVSWHHDHH